MKKLLPMRSSLLALFLVVALMSFMMPSFMLHADTDGGETPALAAGVEEEGSGIAKSDDPSGMGSADGADSSQDTQTPLLPRSEELLPLAEDTLSQLQVSSPVTVATGADAEMQVLFTTGVPLAAGELLFRVVLDGSRPGPQISANDNYSIVPGTASEPAQDPSDPAQVTAGTYWVVWKNAILQGNSTSFLLTKLNPFSNYITANGATSPVEVSAYLKAGTPDVPVYQAATGEHRQAEGSFVAQATKFDWLPAAVNYAQDEPGQHGVFAGDIIINLSSQQANNMVGYGQVATDELTFRSRFVIDFATMPVDPALRQPYLLITEANMRNADGSLAVNGSDYLINDTITIGSETYITDFTLIKSVQNQEANPQDFTSAGAQFKIVGAEYNRNAMVVDEGLRSWDVRSFLLRAVDAATPGRGSDTTQPISLTALPKAAVSPQTGTPVAKNIPSPDLGDLALSFQNRQETGTETLDNFVFAKKIVNIGSTSTAGTAMDYLGAFASNIVRYQFGNGNQSNGAFVNLQKTPIDRMVIEDSGFNPDELLPYRVYLGSYRQENGTSYLSPTDGTITLTVTYDGRLDYTERVFCSMANLTPIPIPNYEDATGVSFTYENLASDFRIMAWPSIDYIVQELPQEREYDWLYNTASFHYVYHNTADQAHVDTSDRTSTARFRYKIKNDTFKDTFSYHKELQNLTGAHENPVRRTPPSAGDIFGYKALVDNSASSTSLTMSVFADTISANQDYWTAPANDVYAPGEDSSSSTYTNHGVPANLKLLISSDGGANYTELTGTGLEAYIGSGKTLSTLGVVVVDNMTHTLTLNFAPGAALPAGEILCIGYTAQIKLRLSAAQLERGHNDFELLDDTAKVVARGSAGWAPPLPPIAMAGSRKTASNITKDVAASANVAPGDIIVFTVKAMNTGAEPINELTLVDTSRNMNNMGVYPFVAYPGNGAFDSSALSSAHPLYDLVANDAAAPAPPNTYGNSKVGGADGEKIRLTVSESKLNTNSANPSTFDPTEVTVAGLDTTLASDGSFSIYLGDSSELYPGDFVSFTFVLKVSSAPAAMAAGDKLVNAYELQADSQPVDTGYVILTVNDDDVVGTVHVVKNAAGIPGSDGSMPVTSNLVDGERLLYTIDVGNYHLRYNNGEAVNITGLVDQLPKNISLRIESGAPVVEVYRVTLSDTGEWPAKDQWSPITVFDAQYEPGGDYQGDRLTVDFEDNGNYLQLDAGLASAANALVAKNRIVVTYEAVVDTSSGKFSAIPTSVERTTNTNVVDVFLEEATDELYTASGDLYDDSDDDLDDNPLSFSYVRSSTLVNVVNSAYILAGISKTVHDDSTYTNLGNPQVNLSSAGESYRYYKITIENRSFGKELELSKVLDILPRYESYVNGSAKIVAVHTVIGSSASGTHEEETRGSLSVSTGTYAWQDNGGTVQRLVFNNAAGRAGTFTLSKAAKASWDGGRTLTVYPSRIEITFSTRVDKTLARTEFRNAGINRASYQNRTAFYAADPLALINLVGSKGQRVDDGELSQNWDGMTATALRYQNAVDVNLYDDSTAPFIGIKPFYNIQAPENPGPGQSDDYNLPFTPGDLQNMPGVNIAWTVSFGNSAVNGMTPTPIQAGSKLVLELPSGLSYKGFVVVNGAPQVPSYLGNALPQQVDYQGRTFLVWTVGETFNPGSGTDGDKERFTIRTTTDANSYTDYNVNAYFIPPSDQYFYENVISDSAKRSQYVYSTDWVDFGAMSSSFTAPAGLLESGRNHLVRASANVNTYDGLGISPLFTLSEDETPGNAVSTEGAEHILTLSDTLDERDHSFTYAMYIRNIRSVGFEAPVVINRLPALSDATVASGMSRGSEAVVHLLDNGAVTLGDITPELVAIDGNGALLATPPALSDQDDFDDVSWNIEYFVGSNVGSAFGPADFDPSSTQPGRWLSAGQITDASKVTAFRLSPSAATPYTLPRGYALKVSVHAALDKASYTAPFLVGFDSFAFHGTAHINSQDYTFTAEPSMLGVRTHVPYHRSTVTKLLQDPSGEFRALYGSSFTGEAPHAFTIRLANSGEDGTSTTPLIFDQLRQSGAVYKQTQNGPVYPKNITLAQIQGGISEALPTAYYHPLTNAARLVEQGGTDAYGNITYHITVVNEPYIWRVSYDANGGTGSQSDPRAYHHTDTASILGQGGVYRSGYTFLGWNTNSMGTGAWYYGSETALMTANVTLYAQWRSDTYPPPPPPPPPPPRPRPPTIDDPEDPDTPVVPGVTQPPGTPRPPTSQVNVPITPEPEAGIGTGNWLQDLLDGKVPLVGFGPDDWSLLSAIMSIIALISALVLGICALVRRKKGAEDEEGSEGASAATDAMGVASVIGIAESAAAYARSSEKDEDEERRQRTTFWTILAIVAGVAVIIVWLILDWPLIHMVWINQWTIFVALVFIVHVVAFIVHKTRRGDKKEKAEASANDAGAPGVS